jgi:nucleotide-binding universal stress UspA family protein
VYSRISVAVDGSNHALKAFEKALEMAEHFNSSLDIIHVIDDSAYGTDSAEAFESVEKLKARGQKLVDDYKGRALEKNLKVRGLVEVGDPSQTIIETAEQNNSDLIIIGSRGLGLFKELLLGSVSHKVALHSKCPVMMVR